MFRRTWLALVAVVTLPLGVLGVGLTITPAAGADPASTPPIVDSPSASPLPPRPPTNLTVTWVTATSVTVTWTASTSPNIQAYIVKYTQPFTNVDVDTRTSGESASIRLSPASEYRLSVAAMDSTGNYSNLSNQVTVMTPILDGSDTVPPTAPGNLSVRNGRLSWTSSTDNVGVVGYDVYRYNGGYFSRLAGATTTPSYPVTPPSTPAWGGSYYVRARDAAGNLSIASNVVTPPTRAGG
ncbi:fibronectin type III domain-containing protein [Plantactinospora siamensis]|uniref:Fibronectin type III domain-containing protein n=1 Tax=Plantactinospora siamensis TaxID=555372 RepID=A0ABV6P5V8_9ACTN